MPLGVHDSNPPPVNAIAANAAEVTPSTSLSAEMASNAARSSMWPGTGCCSSMPSIEGSADNALSTSTSSSVVVLTGSSTVRDVIPTATDRLAFICTYAFEAGSAPTMTAARQGTCPASSRNCLVRTDRSASVASAIARPSIIRAATFWLGRFSVDRFSVGRFSIDMDPLHTRCVKHPGGRCLAMCTPRW